MKIILLLLLCIASNTFTQDADPDQDTVSTQEDASSEPDNQAVDSSQDAQPQDSQATPQDQPAEESTQDSSTQDSSDQDSSAQDAAAQTPAEEPEEPYVPSPAVEVPVDSVTPGQSLAQIGKAEATEKNLAPTAEQDVVIEEGISTLDQEGGNWLLKRRALEKTVDTIELINAVFTKILDARMDLVIKRNNADKAYDQFVTMNGFKVGELISTLENLVTALEKEREAQGGLTNEEREALATINKKIVAVEQTRKSLEALMKIDESIDEALMQAEQEAKKSHAYQMSSWHNFQTIKKVLSDEKAEALYLETDGLYKNMQAIYAYLNGELKNYFDSIVKKLYETMASMQKDIDALKQDGIDLAAEVKRYEGHDEVEAQEAASQERKPLKAETPKGWFGQFFSWVGGLFK